jgi:hypothetical protein
MNQQFISDFATKHTISEVSLKLLLVQAMNLAAKEKYPEYDCIAFDLDKQKVFFILSTTVIEKPLHKMGRRFLLLSLKFYFNYLLSETYPDKFKFLGTPSERMKEFYNNQNEDSFRHSSYENGSYCSACHQSPCMCSDREASSSVYDF